MAQTPAKVRSCAATFDFVGRLNLSALRVGQRIRALAHEPRFIVMFPRFRSLFCLALLACFFLGATSSHAAPLREPLVQTPPADLMTPAAGNLYEIPVVVICYLPSKDGVRLDIDTTDLDVSLSDMYEKIMMMNRQIKFALEEGSRYHGYMNRNARPTLGYKIVSIIIVNEAIPLPTDKSDKIVPDYKSIIERFNGRNWVENRGIKEFWIWGYPSDDFGVNESNMSSPTTGNISNSFRREGDMPVYEHSYIVYNYNYERSAAEAIHDHGHQMEAMMNYINQQQDGNTKLFNDDFMKRVGWTHCPSNTKKDYDYLNETVVESDVADWRPDGGGRTLMVNCHTWGDIPYPWPGGVVPEQQIEANWYIFWRQNIPGENNGLSVNGENLTNWWEFVGDWDGAARRKLGLHEGKMKTEARKPVGAAF